MTFRHLKNDRPTIAVLTNMMATPFSEGVAFGAAEYARQHNLNILIFAGSEFDNPDPVSMSRHRVFDLVDTELVDGLILPLGALSRFISEEKKAAFLRRFDAIPVVTVTSQIPGYVNVGYSAQQGMFDLVDHLVQEHGVERFAFCGATGHHLASLAKQDFFLQALARHGLSFDERFFIASDMRRNAVVPGLDALFAEGRIRPQAIVAATDNQALSILARLLRKGIRVPEDVIVTGSMGGIDGQFCEPALTTILEPTFDLGWQAAARLASVLAGKAQTQSLQLATSLLVRRSCGCHAPGSRVGTFVSAAQAPPARPDDDLLALQEALDAVIAAVGVQVREALPTQIVPNLLAYLHDDLHGAQSASLVGVLDRHIYACRRRDVLHVWGQLAQALQQYLLGRLAGRRGGDIEAQLVSGLGAVMQACTENALAFHEYGADKYVGVMREIGIQLNSEFDLDAISLLLARELQISDCYLSVFDKPGDRRSLLANVLSMHEGRKLDVSEQLFPAAQLMPWEVPTYRSTFALIVMPLCFSDEFLGLFVVKPGLRTGAVYEGLLTLFASALKNRMQLRQLGEAEEKFSDIAHSASDWLWALDEQGRFVYSSDGVVGVLGYTVDEIIGRSFVEFLCGADAARSQEIQQLMRSRAGFSGLECAYQHHNGHQRTLLAVGKPIFKDERLIGHRGAFKDVTELKSQEARIRTLAYRDALTDLPNRALFLDRLNVVMAAAQRGQFEFAVLFLDLDGFKLVNDSMGHDAGDVLLGEVAKLLMQCVRDEDSLARFGGDEFAVILPSIQEAEGAASVAARMAAVLDAPIEIRGQSVFITTSIGIAVYPQDGTDAETLLKNADKAMYKAKQNGKNRYVFYEPLLEEKINRTVFVRNLLHRSLRNKSFQLVYQPQVDAETGAVLGVEALIRLPYGQDQMVSPFEFIPMAEEIGLIDEMGLWVFETACMQQKAWAEQGCRLKCSINVSAKQLLNADLLERFMAILRKHHADAGSFILEVTESAVIEHESLAHSLLQAFSEQGLAIAIDDFGTGYASLSCLRKIPAGILKIDRSFIDDCTHNEASAGIVAAIVKMANSLQLRIVAEGVETREQAQFVRSLGCQEMQGYYFARPLKAEQVLAFVASQQNAGSAIL